MTDSLDSSRAQKLQHLWFTIVMAALVIVGLSLAARLGGSALVLLGLASMMPNAVLGFIFGIPKTISPANGEKQGMTANNSLEQISDWLTKMIVGVGLVELYKVPIFLHKLIDFISHQAPALSANNILLAIVFFSSYGFFLGYIYTRTILSGMMKKADDGLADVFKQADDQLSQVDLTIDSSNKREISPEAKSAAGEIRAFDLEKLTTPESVAIWAKAQLSAGSLTAAEAGYQKAIKLKPDDARIRFEHAAALEEADAAPQAVIAELMTAKGLLKPDSDSDLRLSIYLSLTYLYLFQEPAGYENALSVGREYLAIAGRTSSPGLQLNLACALGQKADILLASNAGAKESTDYAKLKDEAILLLKAVVQQNPELRSRIADLAGIGSHVDSQNLDLKAFADDAEFKKVAGIY